MVGEPRGRINLLSVQGCARIWYDDLASSQAEMARREEAEGQIIAILSKSPHKSFLWWILIASFQLNIILKFDKRFHLI